jgi:hypothetical protein
LRGPRLFHPQSLGPGLRGRQLGAQLLHRGLRDRQLSPKAGHQRGKQLVRGSRLIDRHTRTLRTQDQPGRQDHGVSCTILDESLSDPAHDLTSYDLARYSPGANLGLADTRWKPC